SVIVSNTKSSGDGRRSHHRPPESRRKIQFRSSHRGKSTRSFDRVSNSSHSAKFLGGNEHDLK
ncbi:hypothetical protein PENTCL1PPCAC_7431, partial [Pristionchus entomophagus]